MKRLLKHEVFAIRGEEWLFQICPISWELQLDSFILPKAQELQNNDVPKSAIGRFFHIPKDFDEYKKLALTSPEFSEWYKNVKETRKKIWDEVREQYSLVEVKKAGSFQDHLIIIKENETGDIYEGLCNNYGGDNPFIEFTKYEKIL